MTTKIEISKNINVEIIKSSKNYKNISNCHPRNLNIT